MKFKHLVVAALTLTVAVLGVSCSSGSESGDGAGSGEASAAAQSTTTAKPTGEEAIAPSMESGKTMGTPLPKGADSADYNIAQIAAGTPAVQTLTRLVLQAGFLPLVRDSGPFTVLAPTDDAFAALQEQVGQPALTAIVQDIPQLQTVLKQHVIPGTLTTDDLKAANGTSLEDAAGTKLLVEVKGSDIYVGGAKIVLPDVKASNGIIQVIDTVIVKPNG